MAGPQVGPGRRSPRLLWLAVAAPAWTAYLVTLSPTVPLEDGGEMIAPAATLGVNHPPGYPLYALVGRLACLLPVGDPAFRMNLLSASCGATACGVAAVVAAGLAGSGVAGVVAGLALAWSTQVWWQSVIAEKYAASLCLHALIGLGLAAGLARARRSGPDRGRARWAPGLALVYGLSMSHHGQTVYFAPAAAFVVWDALRRIPPRARARGPGFLAVMLLLGLSVKLLYPPIRAAQRPLFNWQSPHTAPRLAAYLAGAPYQYRIFYWSPRQVAVRFVTHLRDFPPRQFGWPGALLSLAGVAWLWRRNRRALWVWGSVWATGTLYCVNFALEGIAIQTYYLPVFFVEALGIACGVAEVRERLGRGRARRVLAGAGVAAWLAWLAASHGRSVDRSRHFFAWDYSRSVLRSVAPNALLIAFADYDVFPLWYTHFICGSRPDVLLATSDLVRSAKSGRERVRFLYAGEPDTVPGRIRTLEMLERGDPGRPVHVTVVYRAIENALLVPWGAGYRYVWDPAEVARADVLAEWRWSRRWMPLRGVFDEAVPKDSNTRSLLSYYAYSDYRRAYVLSAQGRHAEAVAMYRRALRWPDFLGVGPAAAHAGIAGELWTWKRDAAGAVREYATAAELTPEWLPAPRALGALYLELGRWSDAVRVFREIRDRFPGDPEAVADAARVEALAARRKAGGPGAVPRNP